MATNSNSQAAQDFVPIKEVRDGIAILKDGGLRMVLMASSLNFALKSSDEQQAITMQFQNFLNSLDFTCQFFIQSRRLDIRPYIASLEERLAQNTNDLLKVQIKEYIGFIKNFTETVSIMTKTFFVVVPYTPASNIVTEGPAGMLGGLFGKATAKEKTEKDLMTFEENKTQLEQRVSIAETGLIRCGVKTFPLGTEELIELYYKLFNPGEVEKPITSALQT
ncbi:MAG: hypothetical protein WC764_02400 [Candidatus Paceibacterota bacterium]|jgi:hypothetical protein